ncbi:flagellar export chaperone FlgN [Angustibacter luteus]|uniref:Flagellar export chaperone FlgN n=1 Tax=Angustibacter luteus TaxID=658456 RepID=A0ABW1JIG3_9ACTN
MGLAEVSTVLWTERELLELLLFKLEEEQLVLASGRARWLAHATREVEMVIEQIRGAELSRAVAVDELAAELGLLPGPSLTALADAAPAPWSEMLRDHRQAFLDLTDEISQISKSNRELLLQAARTSREVLMGVEGHAAQTYTPHGTKTMPAPSTRVIDRAL